MGDSRQSVATLQTQLDDFRERSRKDLLEAQRNSKDRLAELQKVQSNLKAQQEEVRMSILELCKTVGSSNNANFTVLSLNISVAVCCHTGFVFCWSINPQLRLKYLNNQWMNNHPTLHVFADFSSEEGAAGVQRGKRQRSVGQRPSQQPPETLGERTRIGEERP